MTDEREGRLDTTILMLTWIPSAREIEGNRRFGPNCFLLHDNDQT